MRQEDTVTHISQKVNKGQESTIILVKVCAFGVSTSLKHPNAPGTNTI